VKASLLTNAPRFSAARMIDEYAERIYPARAEGTGRARAVRA
jgi:hypothetical protein